MDPLSNSLGRLADAVRATAAALDQLRAALEVTPDGPSRYTEAGAPFGPSSRAKSLWNRFAQATTIN